MRRISSSYFWFFLTFSVACLLFALEELSWGQRLLGFQSTEFFIEHSDQKEVNVHNILQKRFYFKTKHVAARVLFYYGSVLPILALDDRIGRIIRKTRVLIPPVSLSLGFLISALMMWDKPTGREEEIGELLFAACFVLFMIWGWLMMRENRGA